MEIEAKKLAGDAKVAKKEADDANKKADNAEKDVKKAKPAGPPGLPSELGGKKKPAS
jgi:hypothetical protein